MAKEYDYICSAHPVVEGVNREQKVYFTVPDEINSQTGILLLIAGFGGTPENNVYKKMRRDFSEEFNLVVVQTSYLGTEFMNDNNNINVKHEELTKIEQKLPHKLRERFFMSNGSVKFQDLLESELPFNCTLKVDVQITETDENYVELGPIQAIDCVNALSTVIEILKDNGYSINTNKIIAYGHSHGAYIALLANRFYPQLFSLIIDGSAWLFPRYVDESRILNFTYKSITLAKVFKYKISSMNCDRDIRNLKFLYNNFNNKTNIVVFQGVTDNLIDHWEKKELFSTIDNVEFNLITVEKVDGEIIKSTNHGDYDFVKLFKYVMSQYPHLTEKNDNLIFYKDCQFVETSHYNYEFFFENQVPRMNKFNKK